MTNEQRKAEWLMAALDYAMTIDPMACTPRNAFIAGAEWQESTQAELLKACREALENDALPFIGYLPSNAETIKERLCALIKKLQAQGA